MKQKFILLSAAVLCTSALCLSLNKGQESKISDLALENIEALTDDETNPVEPVYIPCIPGGSECRFETMDGNGNHATTIVPGYMKIGA